MRAASERPPRRWPRRVIGWGLQLAVLGLVLWLVTSWQQRDLVPQGDSAPGFELRDLTGKTVRLEDYRGKQVVVHFWATWCGVCRREFGDLNAFQAERGDGVALLTIVADGESPEALQDFVAEHDLRYPVLLGTPEVLAAYAVRAYPTSYIVGADGRIQDRTVGYTPEWSLRARASCARW